MTDQPTPSPWQIEGALVVSSVADWHRRLVERMASTPGLVIDLGQVTAIDVFGFQLLLSARRSTSAAGQPLSFSALPPIWETACLAAGVSPSEFVSSPS